MITQSVNKIIRQISPYVPGRPIEEVKRELGLKKVIKLASNENPYGPSPKVVAAIAKEARSVHRYPDGSCFYLRKELAKHLNVDSSQLIFGNGSDEIIIMAVRAFVNPGDEVIMARPSFLIYSIASRIADANIREIPLKNFRYDLVGMKKAVTSKTKIIFLGNPDNPCGQYILQKEMASFLSGLSDNILVFIDEAYYEYVDAKDYVDSLKLLSKHKNVIVSRTFSKMYGLAGLRVGYGIGDKDLVDLLNRIREPFNVNSVAQAAAVACLRDRKYYKDIAADVKVQRKYVCQELDRLQLVYENSFTNFIMIKIGQGASVICDRLLHKGVIVRNMTSWGLHDYIRVTLGTRDENRMFIRALEQSLKK